MALTLKLTIARRLKDVPNLSKSSFVDLNHSLITVFASRLRSEKINTSLVNLKSCTLKRLLSSVQLQLMSTDKLVLKPKRDKTKKQPKLSQNDSGYILMYLNVQILIVTDLYIFKDNRKEELYEKLSKFERHG